jgi:hypothetical protein
MAQILFDYGATPIPIFSHTRKELIDAIIDAMKNMTPLENLDLYMEKDQIEYFQKVFERVRMLPPSKDQLNVWVDYGPEGYEGLVAIKVISNEALQNKGIPYVLCRFGRDY